MYQQLIDEFIHQERLPQSYGEDARDCFLPLLHELEEKIRECKDPPFVLGINGAQGTGKSTLADLMSHLLQNDGFRVANLSIDDFYYSKAKRRELAESTHPLLASRGVPGTHDVELALDLFQQFREAEAGQRIALPGFDKSIDDCIPFAERERVIGPIDIIILEGWFVGATAQAEQDLEPGINELEREEDRSGAWRRYVNQQLAGTYQTLFQQLDLLVMLRAPEFEAVLNWRNLQEEKLREKAGASASGLMNKQEIERFIQHFERLSRHCLSTLPNKADRVYELDTHHRIQLRSGS